MSREAQTDLEIDFETELGRYVLSFDGSELHWKTLRSVMKRRFPQCELLDHWKTREISENCASGTQASITFTYICDGREKKRQYRVTD